MISQFAQNEQYMNAVERVLFYSDLPPEGNAGITVKPPAYWPSSGEIKFSNVELAYREDLPLILRGINFYVHPGEKVEIA